MSQQRKVVQIRYYGENDPRNWPTDIEPQNLQNGTAFSKYAPIYQIGIQTNPGLKVYINDGTLPVMIGSTGIYELNVENLTEIVMIIVDPTSLNYINSSSDGYIIVDLLYEDNGGAN